MANKILRARTIHMHDIEANWNQAENFIPVKGEVVIYDVDDEHPVQRFKLGDGVTSVNDLPFVIEYELQNLFSMKDNVFYIDGGRITDYKNS